MSDRDLSNRSSQVPCGSAAAPEPDQYLDVPEDAGKYRDALVTILLRVPAGWNRSIMCGPGWYRLIAELHAQLCEIDVDYEVLQVKEKFGKLRYNARSEVDDTEVQLRFDTAMYDAEALSATICEWCGDTGKFCVSKHDSERRYRTLCRKCRTLSSGRGQRFRPV